MNPACIRDSHSPVKSPSKYKAETLKNVFLLMLLHPFIEAGYVNMIPNPGDFNYALRKQIYDLARARLKRNEIDKKSKDQMYELLKQDHERRLLNMPETALANMIRSVNPGLLEDQVTQTLRYMKTKQAEDPLALLQDLQPGEEGSQLMTAHMSPNFEMGLYLALLTGSFIYTDSPHRWSELTSIAGTSRPEQELLAQAVSNVPITFLVNPLHTFEARKSGCLGGMRKALRNVWAEVQKPSSNGDHISGVISYLKEAVTKTEAEWASIQKRYKAEPEGFPLTATGKITCKIPSPGFGINAVYRLLLSHSRRQKYLEYVPMAMFLG
jgi:hypothetical protein